MCCLACITRDWEIHGVGVSGLRVAKLAETRASEIASKPRRTGAPGKQAVWGDGGIVLQTQSTTRMACGAQPSGADCVSEVLPQGRYWNQIPHKRIPVGSTPATPALVAWVPSRIEARAPSRRHYSEIEVPRFSVGALRFFRAGNTESLSGQTYCRTHDVSWENRS
jgi:hypothetical protein